MWRALFYKEWIKTRLAAIITAGIVAAMVAYAFIESEQNFRTDGAVMVWNAVITKDLSLLPGLLRWAPAFTALLFGLAQFVPEIVDKRIKLTFHLPMSETKILATMLAYGLTVLTAVYEVAYIVLAAGFSVGYPSEIVAGMCLRSLPWFMAGICVYLLTTWVCMEPLWRWKIAYSLLLAILVAVFFINAPSGAYAPFLPWLAGLTVVFFAFPFHSAARFKDGAQK